ncbi:PilZ domain-containing protein [Desulforhabdus amnigena]|uniref:PilZ domain-containing protein n=1 Tax=Desulforhabdus amnigena TaxID=40218 RepID=A0A9W6CX01_9BACT|nr:PilZ domain-containing protein [Desulforhabdus amnigena]NLJ27058.1 hypothetical protein [Deltaproteobacteria bacterium]GLI34139.1 hypothetical protein DAMNIGENAA_15720 [Desulforhabdus amnigena]
MTDKKSHPPKVRVATKPPPCLVIYEAGGQARNGSSLHFNATGMLIICTEPAPLRTKLKLLLQFQGLRNPFELQGEVVWTNIHGSADSLTPRGMGVKFLNVERDMERVLSKLAERYETHGNMYECYYT